MKRFIKFKKTKNLLKFLAIPALLGTIVATASYGLVSNTNNNLTSQQIGLTNHDASVANQPTINDVVNGDVSSLSQPITTSNGNFILPTLNHNHIPGMIKLNSFVSGLYGINFDNFDNYHVRQIVQNYNDQNQYFVLLVNDSADVTVSWDHTSAVVNPNISFTITNPGHILSVIDTGTNFNITADYELGAPILDTTLNSYYEGMYFQPPLPDTAQQFYSWSDWDHPWTGLTPNILGITETKQNAASAGAGSYVYTWKSISSTSVLKHLDETWTGYSKNIATLLYLNSLNNMVFASNKINNSGSDVLYIFGGNEYINLWFYTFYVNNQAPTTTPVMEYASAYANYGFHFGEVAPNIASASFSSSDVLTQKAYNFKLKNEDNGNSSAGTSWQFKKYIDASFFGYYVSGAKLVNKPNPQILLTLTVPNFTLATVDKPIVFTTNASYISWSAVEQNPASFYSTYYGSIPLDSSIQTTGYRQNQVDSYTDNGGTWRSSSSWGPRYSNYSYTFMNSSSNSTGQNDYAVTADANDGMQSRVYNKVVAYVPEDIGANNVALSYNRDGMRAIITTKDGTKATSAKLSLYKSDTRLNSLSNISYTDQTWFLWFHDTNVSKDSHDIIYFFTYDDTTNQVFFSQTNLSLGDGTEILNILPLNQDYIYVLSRKAVAPSVGLKNDDYEVTPLLYHLTDIKGNYNQNLQYNNLITDSAVIKTDGVPAYSNSSGIQNAYQKAIWGTVGFKDIDYLTKAGFLANPASFLADDPSALQTLVSYQPGWDGQDFKVSAKANADNQLQLSVSIKYFNGQYFSPQQLSAQSALTQTYGGFSALPTWVLPVAIAVPILFLAIILALGLGLGIPMARTRKLQDKGFTQTFKKVDTLTSAVGSVYKKIITETSTIKKKPQMLKSATKSIKKPEVSAPKPSTPKPVGTAAPTKPIFKSAVSPTRPIINKPNAPTPNMPIKPSVKPPVPGFAAPSKKPS